MRKKLIILFLIGSLLLALPNLTVAGDESNLFLITEINKDEFPDIRVSFRVVDAHGKTISGKKEEDISLYENGKPITDFQLIEHDDAPVNIVYVIDLGQDTNYETFGPEIIRKAITFPFLNGYFRDGKDTVQLLGRLTEGQHIQTKVLFDSSNDGDAFLKRVNEMSLNPTSGPSEALGGIKDALKELTNVDSQQDSFTSLVFLTHLLDTYSNTEATALAQELIAIAQEKRIPIFTFQTRIGGEDTQALTNLSSETGGEYLRLLKDNEQSVDFDRIFKDITDQRMYYSLTYRSTSSQSDNRKVTIGPAGARVENATDFDFYAVDVHPANIKILSPADNSTSRIELHFGDEDEAILQPDTLSISAQLTNWPDDYPRNITNATLLVNDEPVTSIETSPNDTEFDFTWNIKDILNEGTFPFVFKVVVMDELGMEAKSDPVTVNLDVTKWNPLKYCSGNLFDSHCLSLLLPIFVILILFVAVVVFLVFNLMSRSRKATFHRTFRTPRETVFVPGKKERASTKALAMLKVLEGPTQMQDLDLEIRDYVTHLGRDPEQSTISFYPEGNTSISGKHCTLELYNDTFFISDNHSLNGTTLNNEELEPDKPYQLKDGDLIELGDLSVRGVKLMFTIPKVTKEHIKKDDTFYGNRDETSG